MSDYYDDVIAAAAARAEHRRRDRHRVKGDRHSASWVRNRGNRRMPFCGVDGEGAGQDRYGRQNYLLLRAGEFELFDRNRRLTTMQCLDFILSLPRGRLYVGFFFGYDATMLLRDLDRKTTAKLFSERIKGYIWWNGYGIDYKPRQYLRVCRQHPETRKAIPNSSRTIDETGGFFQAKFETVIDNWADEIELTADERNAVAAGKAGRGNFKSMTRAIRRYCAIECDLLARVMEAFRRTCIEADIVPQSWRGAGWIAGALHRRHGTLRRPETQRDPAVNHMAERAYYGGRFEVTRVGRVPGPLYEYDINSAYPAAMRLLPCPLHTSWRPIIRPDDAEFYVAEIAFDHPKGSMLCGLPHRFKGRLKWPRRGTGVYWAPEIRAAQRLGMVIKEFHGGFAAELNCDCKSYEWIAGLYQRRKEIGKKTRGYPIKLGINGAYGKLAQRVGAASYRDMIAAGIITAITRSWLLEAAAHDPASIVMLATDGIYSLAPLPLAIGDQLGQWETKTYDNGIFIVQPGVYWPGDMTKRERKNQLPKTRGLPMADLLERTPEFESAWSRFITENGSSSSLGLDMSFLAGPPVVTVPLQTFIGLRLGLKRKDMRATGKWLETEKKIRFEWIHKRRFDNWQIAGEHVLTYPYEGRLDFMSQDYAELKPETTERELITEAAPDFPSWSAVDAMLDEAPIDASNC